ncbi:hypothetical protein AB6A40_002041 [Gnathostoma spinigerum]|uniref:Receptor-type tyrosine-protein phosphatase U-like Fn3 domain-containing protein n=1 Tax=Gnathostoma spinigerum TaxID=75299 RepID=A0ABD6EF83_9BILA
MRILLQIRASTIHSLDGSVKEIAMSGSLGARQDPYHKLMNLTPGSAYNVTLSTIEERRKRYGVRRVKTIWAVFSTLKQGEYVVTSPRLAATTDLSASIVWQKIDHEKPVDYQIQYTLLTGNGMSTILDPLPENHCKCPKMSCDWLCALVFNLHRRPQDHAFQIRAKVDGIWNKWVPVVERPWSIMERACSINPPPFFVDHLNDTDYMRLIEFGNVDAFDTKTWRYVVVVDQRGGVDSSLSAIDISQLSDKATAEHNEVPYYITAAITPEEIKQWTSFRIGDGKLYGGYLNYPLSGMTDPKWYLIPLSRTENEIMEPHLKSCGLNEDGRFVCELTVLQVLSHIPRWLIFSILLLIILPVTVLIIYTTHCIRQRQSHKGSDSTRKKAQPAPKITSNRSKVVSHGFRMQTQQIPFCSRMSSGSPSAQRQSHVHKQCIGCDECRSLLDSVVGLCGQQSTAHIDSASLFERSDRPESNKLTRQSYRTKCDLCSVCHPNCS